MSATASVRLVVALVVVGFCGPSLSGRAGEPSSTQKPAAQLKPLEEKRLPLLYGGFGGAGAQEQNDDKPATVFVVPPISVKAAKTWEKLGQTINFSFANETPLEDVLKHIRKATADAKANQGGLSIYVDPIGLQEAEKTLTSTVTIDLEDVPVSLGLKLILSQLGMRYYVDPHGIVMIVSGSEEGPLSDSPSRILEELATIRARLTPRGGGMGPMTPNTATRDLAREVAALKEQVAELQGMVKGLSERIPTPPRAGGPSAPPATR